MLANGGRDSVAFGMLRELCKIDCDIRHCSVLSQNSGIRTRIRDRSRCRTARTILQPSNGVGRSRLFSVSCDRSDSRTPAGAETVLVSNVKYFPASVWSRLSQRTSCKTGIAPSSHRASPSHCHAHLDGNRRIQTNRITVADHLQRRERQNVREEAV
jgi:hypothetical protein